VLSHPFLSGGRAEPPRAVPDDAFFFSFFCFFSALVMSVVVVAEKFT
jgi:hypothetical protein